MKKRILYLLVFNLFAQILVAQPPVITSFTPASAGAGAGQVTIRGTHLYNGSTSPTVRFGVATAVVYPIGLNDTMLVVYVPPGAGYSRISVTVDGLTGYSNEYFTATYPGAGPAFLPTAFTSKTDIPRGNSTRSLACGDFNNDGKADMVVANFLGGSTDIFLNKGVADSIGFEFQQSLSTTAANSPNCILLGDMDGDGLTDIIAICSQQASIFRNTSSGGTISFASSVDFTIGQNPFHGAIGDLDGDGKPDLVVPNPSNGTISILRNNTVTGSGIISLQSKVEYSTNVFSQPADVCISDFDGDAKPDIAVAVSTPLQITTFRNSSVPGTISFSQTRHHFVTGMAPSVLAAGDIDGDGWTDIVTSGFGGSIAVLRNQSFFAGAIQFNTPLNFPATAAIHGVAITDMDGDGKPDIATADYNQFVVSLFKNYSDPIHVRLQPKVDYTTDIQPDGICLQDVNSDGKPDMLTPNRQGSSISVLRNRIGEPLLASNGSSPLRGPVNYKLTIDSTVQVYNSHPYVQRHYDIEPVNNSGTATARVTLYFTQGEFDNFNSHPAHGADFPTASGDNSNKANIRIYQYHGTSSSSLPGTYTGGSVEINPDDNDIAWNAVAERWEISFDVNGFSGFFASSPGGLVLPARLLSFSGAIDAGTARLQWMTTNEINMSRYELQRSDNGLDFITVAKIPAKSNFAGTTTYQADDKLQTTQLYYYRISMVNVDGSFEYSKVITVRRQNAAAIFAYTGSLSRVIYITHPVNSPALSIQLIDLSGRIIKAINGTAVGGQTIIDASDISAGVYIVRMVSGQQIFTDKVLVR